MDRTTQKYRFSVAQYHQMGATGILSEEQRVELIKGEIFEMSPISSLHAGTVKLLISFFHEHMKVPFVLSVQDPITLNSYSEPQPDVAVLKPRTDHYTTSHPRPLEVLLLVEVADSSLLKDRQLKLPLYARADIPEVWIVNLVDQLLEVYTDPEDGLYKVQHNYEANDMVSQALLGEFGVELILKGTLPS